MIINLIKYIMKINNIFYINYVLFYIKKFDYI